MTFKEKILTIPDQEYRDIPAFSYSLGKDLDESGPKSMLERVNKKSDALTFGSLVDILITDKNRKDEIFWTKTLVVPTASLLQLADALLLDSIVMDYSYDTLRNDKLIENKIKDLGLWSTMVDPIKLKAKYDNDIFWDYLRESIEAKGKIILSQETLDAAEHCADVLLHHEFTRNYFIESDGIEILKQPSILYNFKGTQCKARIDLLIVNHNTKIIHVFDIKTGSELPSKFEISFYKYKYYLQVISYLLAVQSIIETTPEFSDYKIDIFKFLYISKKLPDVPVVWEVEEKLLNAFSDGWISGTGEYITGYMELVQNYKFVVDNGIYNVERKVIEKNGHLKINLL